MIQMCMAVRAIKRVQVVVLVENKKKRRTGFQTGLTIRTNLRKLITFEAIYFLICIIS